ncbi:hypothetical protein HZS_6073, partial [Henneguya salminicola]
MVEVELTRKQKLDLFLLVDREKKDLFESALSLNIKPVEALKIMNIQMKFNEIIFENFSLSEITAKNSYCVPKIIEEILEYYPLVTGSHICKLLKIYANIDIKKLRVHQYLCKLKITRISYSFDFIKEKNPKIIQQRKIFSMDFFNNLFMDQNKYIFVDGTSFRFHPRKLVEIVAPRGDQDCEISYRDIPDLTVLLAFNGENIIHYKIFDNNCDTKTFLTVFIAELKDVLSAMNIYKDFCLVLGNEIFWIEDSVMQKFSNYFGTIKVLPFYSRYLNPVETAFSEIKILARDLLVYGEQDQNISEIFKQ